MAPIERTLTKAAPAWLRSRLLLRLLGRLVNQSYTGSRVVSRLRRGQASLDVAGQSSARSAILCRGRCAGFTSPRLHGSTRCSISRRAWKSRRAGAWDSRRVS